jgi:hypothetical protein
MKCPARPTQLLVLCVIASSAILPSAAAAQALAATAARTDVTTTSVTDPIRDSLAGANLSRGQALHRRMRFADARREYMEAAKKLEAGSMMPCEALWLAAEMYYAEGNVSRAAQTLDLVAAKAAAFGHPSMQARALLESAILFEQIGANSQAITRLTRLDAVLSSPHVPGDVRMAIAARRP